MIPVYGLLALAGFEPVSVTRRTRAQQSTIDAYGVPIDPADVDTTITVVMHQASRKQLERANLDAATDARIIYSTTELRTATDDRPDIIIADGEAWEMRTIANYGTLGGIWFGLAVRIE